jgi:hypothetical protein
MRSRLAISAGATIIGIVAAPAQMPGPSTTTPPYLLANPALPAGAVKTVSILTAGDDVRRPVPRPVPPPTSRAQVDGIAFNRA